MMSEKDSMSQLNIDWYVFAIEREDLSGGPTALKLSPNKSVTAYKYG